MLGAHWAQTNSVHCHLGRASFPQALPLLLTPDYHVIVLPYMTPSRTNSCSHPACLPGGALGRQNFSLGRIACEPTELQAGPVSKKHEGTSQHQWNGQILVCLSTDHGSLSTKIVLVLLTPQCAIGRLTQNRLQISLSNDAGWRENSCPEQRHGYWLPWGKGLVLSHT